MILEGDNMNAEALISFASAMFAILNPTGAIFSKTTTPTKTTRTMSDKFDQCCRRFKEEIRTAEARLEQVGRQAESATEHGVDALEARLKEAEAKCDAAREHASEAGHRLKQFLEEKKDTAIAKFEDWKTDHDISKIEKHADKTEQQALDTIVLAAFAILEAEVAIVDALKARKMAIEVAG